MRFLQAGNESQHSSNVVSGSRLVLAGVGAMIAGAVVDRTIYERAGRGDDLPVLFIYSSARRTLSTAGGVLLALGVRDLIGDVD